MSTPPDAPDSGSLPRASRLGLWLFVIYLAFYGGFVWLAAFHGPLLKWRPFDGVNLATIYGFLLIIVPLVLSLIYLRWAPKAQD